MTTCDEALWRPRREAGGHSKMGVESGGTARAFGSRPLLPERHRLLYGRRQLDERGHLGDPRLRQPERARDLAVAPRPAVLDGQLDPMCEGELARQALRPVASVTPPAELEPPASLAR